MTARQEILEAADQLEAAGAGSFTLADMVRHLRSTGSAYAEATIRTMVRHHMCSPSAGVVDLERVSNGRYRRVRHGHDGSPSTGPPSPTATLDPWPAPDGSPVVPNLDHEWYWEGNVQAAVVAHLVAEGWRILRVAGTASKEHGIDVEAQRDGKHVLVEVKGYPSGTFKSGPKAGQVRSAAALPPQARAYFAGGLLAAALMRAEHPYGTVVLALPDFVTYRKLADRLRDVVGGLSIEVWLFDESGRRADASRPGALAGSGEDDESPSSLSR